ncbi:MAG: PKD domain-containing protein [Bellilinea sp.]
MARAATADELLKFRSDGQRSKLFLLIHTPAMVYSARVNQAAFTDPMAQVTYDGGSGTLANVLPGMTMYVGTSAGGWDKGMVRIRKTPTSTIFYIGETSEIPWADNDYLTVVDEIGLWPRHLRLVGQTPFMDYDIAYSDQHASLAPYPVMGPGAALYLPAGGTVNYTPDGSGSWVLGSTISGYLWAAPGAAATQNLTTATPTITYNAAGTYRVALTVTAANGKTSTGYRYIHVYSDIAPPVTDFELLSCQHDHETGGWEFGVRVFAGVSTIRPRSRVFLCADDWYGAAKASIGPLAGAENIVAMGWIDDEGITPDAELSTVDFIVRGPHHWLKSMTGYPLGIQRTNVAAIAWTEMQGLTVDRGLWHLLHWRSTTSLCMDAFLPGDTKLLPTAEAPTASIWDQLGSIAEMTILAKPDSDRYGRLYMQVDVQYLPTASRSGIPTVMEISKDDWNEISIERVQTRQCSMLELSGIVDDTSDPVMSWARGGVFTLHGSAQSIENLLLDNQAAANELAGNCFAKLNNEYPAIDITLAQNNRLIETCPVQRISLSIAADDTPRGIVWTARPILPRRIEHKFDVKSGFLYTILECEAETGGASAIPGITVPISPPPLIGDMNFDVPGFDDWGAWGALTPGNLGLPGYMPQDPPIKPIENTCPTDSPANGPYNLNIMGLLRGDVEAAKFAHIPAVLRTAGHSNPTRYEIRGLFEKNVSGVWGETTDDSFYNVYAHAPGGAIIATGVHDAVSNPRVRTGVLNAAASTKIAYISIQINTQLLRPSSVTVYKHGVGSWIDEGALSWGYFGIGIWASYLNVVGVPAGMNSTFEMSTMINFAAPAGTNVVIRNNGYAAVSGDGYLTTSMHCNPWTQGVKLWEEIIPGFPMVWLSQKHEFTVGSSVSYPIICHGYRNVGAAYVTEHYWMTAWLQQTYRINISGMSVYNLCPLSAWETWLT